MTDSHDDLSPDEFKATAVSVDEILTQKADVLAPCALGCNNIGALLQGAVSRIHGQCKAAIGFRVFMAAIDIG